MTTEKALDLALEALGLYQAAGFGNSTDFNKQHEAFYKAQTAITAIKQARALDKKAENARELGLDYEPVLKDNSNYRYDPPVAEPVAWRWHQAPVKTSWGHDMVVADLAIDKDNTVSVYCERDQTAKVEAMFNPPAAPDLQAELDATNRQVEIMSDALAESRREVVALKTVQEPVAWEDGSHLVVRVDVRDRLNYKGPWVDMGRAIPDKWIPVLYTTPPAQPATEESSATQPAPAQESHKGLSEHLAQATNGRVRIDPVTGDVGIGTPAAQRQWVGLTDEETQALWDRYAHMEMMRAIEAKLKEKNT